MSIINRVVSFLKMPIHSLGLACKPQNTARYSYSAGDERQVRKTAGVIAHNTARYNLSEGDDRQVRKAEQAMRSGLVIRDINDQEIPDKNE